MMPFTWSYAMRSGLLFVSLPSEEKGFTGANIGNKVVIDILTKRCQLYIVDYSNTLQNPGEGSNIYYRSKYYLLTIAFFTRAIIKLIRTANSKPFDFFYFLPSSSLMGLIRDVTILSIIKLSNYKAPVYAHVRNGNYFKRHGTIKSLLINICWRGIDHYICLSPSLAPKNYNKISTPRGKSKIFIIPNSIDKEVTSQEVHLRKKLFGEESPIRILYFSNFIPSKGYILLADAINMLHKNGQASKFKFSFYGTWSSSIEKEKFISLFPHELIESNIVYIGDKINSRSGAREIYNNHDVFCLPTFYPVEAQPRSIIEAMSNGCMVISTNHASIPEMVPKFTKSILLETPSAPELYKTISSLNWDIIESSSQESLKTYNERFSDRAIENLVYEAFEV